MIYIIIGWVLLSIAISIDLYSEGIPIRDILEMLIKINLTVIGFVCMFKGLFCWLI